MARRLRWRRPSPRQNDPGLLTFCADPPSSATTITGFAQLSLQDRGLARPCRHRGQSAAFLRHQAVQRGPSQATGAPLHIEMLACDLAIDGSRMRGSAPWACRAKSTAIFHLSQRSLPVANRLRSRGISQDGINALPYSFRRLLEKQRSGGLLGSRAGRVIPHLDQPRGSAGPSGDPCHGLAAMLTTPMLTTPMLWGFSSVSAVLCC